MSLARITYSAALVAATPLVIAYLLYRSLRQPTYRSHWSERFARYAAAPAAGPLIWIHAVSVGETRAAQPLVEALLRDYPDHRILLTHTTPTGRAVSEALFGTRVERIYLPYDYPFAIRRFVGHYRPHLGVLMETELWPNLMEYCARARIPVVLANARLSERSLQKALRWSRLARAAVAQLAAILAQTETDAARFRVLGATSLSVTGNLKFDADVAPAQRVLGKEFRARIGQRPVFLCASTRDGEEQLLLAALTRARLPAGALLVLVPRHPQRFEAVASLVRASGLTLQRRSDGATVEPGTRIWLGDSMGEMSAYYGAADVAYVGGGLLPFGTHNLIEACAIGCPVLLGEHTFNFAEAAAGAIAAGAALQVHDAAALFAVAARLLENAAERATMAEAALRFISLHQGATARTVAGLAAYLAPV